MTTATCRVFRAAPETRDARETHHRGRFSSCHFPSSTVLVTVEGEIDAANHRALARYVESQAAGATRLVLDLANVEFFGTAGFASLHNINVICSRYGASWELLVGPQVRRVLRICDPDGTLPIGERSFVEDPNASAGDREFLVGGNH
ncbi:anti-anti-sigma factor [Mycobacterium sp. URHB0021]